MVFCFVLIDEVNRAPKAFDSGQPVGCAVEYVRVLPIAVVGEISPRNSDVEVHATRVARIPEDARLHITDLLRKYRPVSFFRLVLLHLLFHLIHLQM